MVVREHPVLFHAKRRANGFRLSLTINLPRMQKSYFERNRTGKPIAHRLNCQILKSLRNSAVIGGRVLHRKTFLVCPSANKSSGKNTPGATRQGMKPMKANCIIQRREARRKARQKAGSPRTRRQFSGLSSEYQNALPGKSRIDNNRRGNHPY